jgi:hypothetical protein
MFLESRTLGEPGISSKQSGKTVNRWRMPMLKLCVDDGINRGPLVSVTHPSNHVAYQIIHGDSVMHERLAAEPTTDLISPIMESGSDLRSFLATSISGIPPSKRSLLESDGVQFDLLPPGTTWGELLQHLSDITQIMVFLRRTRNPDLMAAVDAPGQTAANELIRSVLAEHRNAGRIFVDGDAVSATIGRVAQTSRGLTIQEALRTI